MITRCPVCRASVAGRTDCRRCRFDLSSLRTIEAAARRHRLLARAAFRDGDILRMRRHAERAHFLHHTPESRKLLACALLLNRDFDRALSLAVSVSNAKSFQRSDS